MLQNWSDWCHAGSDALLLPVKTGTIRFVSRVCSMLQGEVTHVHTDITQHCSTTPPILLPLSQGVISGNYLVSHENA